jgi:MFS family permease
LRFALPQLLIAIGSGMTLPFMSLYFRERFGYDSAAVGYLFAAGQLGMTLGFLGGPALHRRLGYVRAIALAQFASLPWFAVLAVTHSAPVAAAAYLLRTAVMNAAHPLMKSFLMESSPPELREGQNALLMFIFGLGWVVGPALGSWTTPGAITAP